MKWPVALVICAIWLAPALGMWATGAVDVALAWLISGIVTVKMRRSW